MAEIDAKAFRNRPADERVAMLAWLARHRYAPDIVQSVRYEPGALVCEVVVYLLRDGSRYYEPDAVTIATRTDIVECPGDAPPID